MVASNNPSWRKGFKETTLSFRADPAGAGEVEESLAVIF
jgi:hypothetical protein